MSYDFGFISLPYRDDLYIIPRPVHPVNTFFVTFLTFFRDTLGAVGKESILYTRFQDPKNSQKNFKKVVKTSKIKLENVYIFSFSALIFF